MVTNQIMLRPDRNRPDLESRLAQKLAEGILENSKQSVNPSQWKEGKKPRVLLIVPPYTRIKRPLDLVRDNIEREGKDYQALQDDKATVSRLQDAGINYLEEMKRAGIPMGLLRVGTAAKRAGYEVQILDAGYECWEKERKYFESEEGSTITRYGLSKKEIAERITEFNPDIVGITCDYTHQWGNAREIADLVKTMDDDKIVVMGGAHAHGLPSDVLLDSPTDYVVLGQADRTFPELLDVLTGRKQKSLDEVEGIAFRRDGEVQQTKPRAFLSKIGRISIPDLSLVDLSIYSGKYHSAGERQLDEGYLLYGFTSIGCNTRCTFCTIPDVQGPWISMREKKLDEYLHYITKQGVTEFIVEDDNLFHDPKWALTAFQKLKEHRIPWVEEGGVSLYSLIALLPEVGEEFIKQSAANQSVFRKTLQAKRDGITAGQLIRSMGESKCYSIYLAVESANDDSLDRAHKPNLNTQEVYTKKIVRMLNEAGIRTTCGLMIGFANPNGTLHVESRKQIKRSIAYGKVLREAGATYINPFIFTPLPGAPHFDRLKGCAVTNTDEGYSHEFGTIDAPDGEWTRDELNLLRAYSLLETEGIEGYKRMLRTGTWPVK